MPELKELVQEFRERRDAARERSRASLTGANRGIKVKEESPGRSKDPIATGNDSKTAI